MYVANLMAPHVSEQLTLCREWF